MSDSTSWPFRGASKRLGCTTSGHKGHQGLYMNITNPFILVILVSIKPETDGQQTRHIPADEALKYLFDN